MVLDSSWYRMVIQDLFKDSPNAYGCDGFNR